MAALLLAPHSVNAQDKGRANPYSKLFEVTDLKKSVSQALSAQQARQPKSTQPKVVCGMIVIPADLSIDPKIRAELPKTDTQYTIRAVPPPVCK
jgi:hypothetical protein